MKRSILILVMTVVCTVSGVNLLQAQYAINRSVFGLGGTETKGAQNRIIGTIGQPLIGRTQNAASIHLAGFWYGMHSVPVGVTRETMLPEIMQLGVNYPNPVDEQATIPFTLRERGHVLLSVVSILGEVMQTLIDGEMTPGDYHARLDGTRYPAGVYFYRLHSGTQVVTKSFVVRR